MSIVDKIRVLETIVKTPIYSVVGFAENRLIYLSTREGSRDLWSMDVETRQVRQITKGGIHGVAKPVEESPLVIYLKDVTKGREQHLIYKADSRTGDSEKLAEFTPMRIFGIAFDGEKIAFTGASQKDISLYLAKINGGIEKLYTLNTIASVTDLNDKYIVGSGMLKMDPKTMEIFIYNLETNEFTIYTPREKSINKAPALDKNKILFETTALGNNRLVIYNIEGKTLDEVKFAYKDYERYNPVEHIDYDWLNGSKIWTIAEKNGRTKVFIDGRNIPLPEGFTESIAIHGEKLYASTSTLVTPYRIFEIDLKSYRRTVLIENKLPEEIAKSLGTSKFIKYKSFDNLEIPTYVVESKKATKPSLTIIYVHGGPWGEVADRWSVMISSLVALGYHIVAPNFRGSTGYGEEFRLLDIGDPGGGDLQDIVYARKWAVEEGIASEVAIMGYSYGGYMTFLATGKYPELWKCGVAGAGVVDWEEMCGLSDALFRQFIDILFAGKRELWKERSPITYVERVKAPLCIIHPQNDTRTPLKPVLKYVNKLLDLGRTFELHVVPDIGHAIVTVEDIFKILLPAAIFLEKYKTNKF